MNRVVRWFVKRKIRAILVERGFPASEVHTMLTAGMKSSEFWMSLVAILLKWLGPHLGMDFPNEGLLAVVGYVISRGLAKFPKAPTK